MTLERIPAPESQSVERFRRQVEEELAAMDKIAAQPTEKEKWKRVAHHRIQAAHAVPGRKEVTGDVVTESTNPDIRREMEKVVSFLHAKLPEKPR